MRQEMRRWQWHQLDQTHTHKDNRFTALFPGLPGWAGARRNLLDFIGAREDNKVRQRQRQLAGRHSILTNQQPILHHPYVYAGFPSCRNPQFILPWDRHQICWLAYPVACFQLAGPYHTTTRFTALFPGPPGWAGARRELLDLMVQGKINRGRHADHPAGRHSVRTNQCPPLPSPHFLQAGCPSCRPTNSVKALKAFRILQKKLKPHWWLANWLK